MIRDRPPIGPLPRNGKRGTFLSHNQRLARKWAKEDADREKDRFIGGVKFSVD